LQNHKLRRKPEESLLITNILKAAERLSL